MGQGLRKSQRRAHVTRAPSRSNLPLDTCYAAPVSSSLKPRRPQPGRPSFVPPQHLDTHKQSPWQPVLFTCLFPSFTCELVKGKDWVRLLITPHA